MLNERREAVQRENPGDDGNEWAERVIYEPALERG